jgi:hypothetical protein
LVCGREDYEGCLNEMAALDGGASQGLQWFYFRLCDYPEDLEYQLKDADDQVQEGGKADNPGKDWASLPFFIAWKHVAHLHLRADPLRLPLRLPSAPEVRQGDYSILGACSRVRAVPSGTALLVVLFGFYEKGG